MKTNLRWMVYRLDPNKNAIVLFNIFDHYRFAEDVADSLKNCKSKQHFADVLHDSLIHYFHEKSEYEIAVVPWNNGNSETVGLWTDVCDQVIMNGDAFLHYVWEYGRRELEGDE